MMIIWVVFQYGWENWIISMLYVILGSSERVAFLMKNYYEDKNHHKNYL